MEILLDFVLQILGELLFQLGFEMLAELGFRGLQEPFRRPKPLHPILAGICYLIFGAVAGLLSLLLLPHLMIDSAVGRVANLVVTPVSAGLFMSLVGVWRRRRGEDVVRLDRFAYGFLFAMAMALVRFQFGGVPV